MITDSEDVLNKHNAEGRPYEMVLTSDKAKISLMNMSMM